MHVIKMWSADFDELPVEVPRKRRKVENKSRSSTPKVEGIPETIEDLATHSRKIAEVRDWLINAGLSPNILLLTGPSGTAKSTTLRIVAKSLGLEVQEWVNPVDKLEYNHISWLEPEPVDSLKYSEPKQIEKFEGFVFRSSRYRSLFAVNSKRIILIEDFPNHFIWKPQEFHNFLSTYKISGQCPIVFICTDDENLNLSHELFPSHIRSALQIFNIKFNPVTHSALLKTLQKNTGSKSVSKDVLEGIAKSCNGDVRTALSSLRFLLTNNPSGKAPVCTIARDANTEFFQTLGRVLYPKRLDTPSQSNKIFVHDVFSILDQFNHKLLSMLHENYFDTFSALNDLTKASSSLSDCDIFMHSSSDLKDYAGLVCILGLMTSNKTTKKGTFRPLKKSRWADLKRQEKQESCNPYTHLIVTRRVLNVDVVPFVKHMPYHATKLNSHDLDRLCSYSTLKSVSSCKHEFKKPLPPSVPSTDDFEDSELVIEEFDD